MTSIITAPNPALSTIAQPVEKARLQLPSQSDGGQVDKTVREIIAEMIEGLLAAKDPVGVGLAAPQIGKSVRIFIAKLTLKSPIQVFINPQIISKSEEKEVPALINSKKIEAKKPKKSKGKMLEGCLSLPNIWGEVIRNREVMVSFLDENGKNHSKSFKGFMAIIIQHEIDHLDGILFPRRVLEQKGTLYESKKDEEGDDVFKELKI